MKAGFVCASSCSVNDNGQILVHSHEYLSLLQWIDLFDEVVLFWAESKDDTSKENWVQLDRKNVSFVSICNSSHSLWRKIKSIKEVAKQSTDYDIFYYRMPSYESLIFYHFQNKGIPHFVEMHGNQESVIMLGTKPQFIKKLLCSYVLKKNQQLCSEARFAVSIGPQLVRDYVRSEIPVLVTTNHLTKEESYPKLVPYHKPHEPINILFVGNIAERKGLVYLFEALRNLHAEKIPFKMILAGSGVLKNYLETYAQNNGFLDSVVFAGQVKHGEDLYKLYREADVFVLPSVAAEGVPRVTHEAMIFGAPVVATDIGSVAWQLDGFAGVVIKPRDVGAIEKGIKDVCFDNAYREVIINNAYNKSLLYSWEKQCEGIRSFVRENIRGL